MQKKIIALAIAGLSGAAFAQSNVTISGTIGASYDQYSLSGATTPRTTYRQNMVSDQSSAVILSGSEKLGNGMEAWFQIDSRLTMDRGNGAVANYNQPYTSSGLGNGNTAIGLRGSWGTFGMGRWDVHYDTLAGIENLGIAPALAARFGHFGLMANVNGAQIALGTRAANALFYVSPNFNGFTGTVAYSTAPAGGEGEANLAAANGDPGNGNAYQIKLNYGNGPWAAVYSYFNFKVEDRNNYTACAVAPVGLALTCAPTATAAPAPADQKSNRLGVAYTFPMGVKLGLAWDRSTVANAAGDRTRTAWMLPISYATGAHTFAFNYAKAGNTTNIAAVGGNSDTSASQWLLGYAYSLSKRTTVGVQYITLNNANNASYSMAGASAANTGLTAATAGEDGKLVSFNVRHAF